MDGYASLGHELVEQLPDGVDAFVLYVGTAGCLVGAGRVLRGAWPALHRVAVEPAESPFLSAGRAGTHRIEGGGIGFWPPLLTRDDFDEVIAVPTEEAFAMARRAAKEEGIFSGVSFGASLSAALAVARRLGTGHRVVTIQVDSGLKYLAGATYQ